MMRFWPLLLSVCIGSPAAALCMAGDAPPAADEGEAATAETPESEQAWYDSVTVTAARTAIDRVDVPANVSVLGQTEVRESAAVTIDGVLRQVPGFATMREQSSVVGTVQTQSVSLRGLGGTTTSRTLVLFDGIPMNDPYGGWVYWAKAPRELVDRVEVVRGGGASIWGNLALGGVINLMTIEPSARSLTVSALQGDHHTNDVNLSLADAGSEWSGWLSGNVFDTEGYHVVREDLRGSIDRPIAKEHQSYLGKGTYAPSPRVSLRLSADAWDEERERGSPQDRGSADSWSTVANASVGTGAGSWEMNLFFRHQDWFSYSTRVSVDRASEAPTSTIFDQPSDVFGASATWSDDLGKRHHLLAGADLQKIEIEHRQDLTFRNGRFVDRQEVEGSQQLAGAFLQDVFAAGSRLSIQAGARYDRIKNHDGRLVNVDLTTGNVTSVVEYVDHDESTFNPSLGAVYSASDDVSVRASVYTGFRAPTPGELYKGFRTGSNTTEANSELEAERLRGAEIGADYHPSSRFFGRVTGFWNELEDLILQTTAGVAGPAGGVIPPCGVIPPRGVCRQRNNVGQVEAVGIELEGEYRPSARWSVALSGLLEETEIESAPQLPDLVGKRVPQSPEESFVLRVRFADPDLLDVTVQGRYVGQRFEDDINTLSIDHLTVADVVLSRQIIPAVGLFLGVENLFDQRYEVLRDTAGLVLVERRTAHIGVRYALR
jgi:outer membrane receptor protein involved in Fe transport